MIKIKNYIKAQRGVSYVVAVLIGVLISILHEYVQKKLIPVAVFLHPLLLDKNSSFLSEVAVNSLFHGLIAVVVCLIAVPLMRIILEPESMRYPLIAAGAYLVNSYWWVANGFYRNAWPFPLEYLPLAFWSAVVTFTIIVLGLYRSVQMPPAEALAPAPTATIYLPASKSDTGRVSTRYLVLMVSLIPGALVATKALSFLITHGPSTAVVIKTGICLSLFVLSALLIRKEYADPVQRQRLMKLNLNFLQAVLASATLLFWSFLKLAFFGSA